MICNWLVNGGSTQRAAGSVRLVSVSARLSRFSVYCLPPADDRCNPVDGALSGVGCAIGEGAERGNAFVGRRAGMDLRLSREPVECLARQHERPAQGAPEERRRHAISRA
jgi:hypothetical protein